MEAPNYLDELHLFFEDMRVPGEPRPLYISALAFAIEDLLNTYQSISNPITISRYVMRELPKIYQAYDLPAESYPTAIEWITAWLRRILYGGTTSGVHNLTVNAAPHPLLNRWLREEVVTVEIEQLEAAYRLV